MWDFSSTSSTLGRGATAAEVSVGKGRYFNDEIHFVSTKRNKQKLQYRRKCYTLKRTNCNNKCSICESGKRGCPGKLYTNLDATEVIRKSEHADGC
ncbi:hypothetical protein T4B_1656 [Trichinella pseudospiralis]|uniref:FLYWCH-type domain-containing protein n=1 Tax=Trichinella pseudospiralis TaxID=6337 RepID=A0A0V1J9U2_TRIPS|nr:hypothetical protein T4C_3100 [Trichinella pseudospiralis]KRZ31710.1 hypothetical protein T4B_1656 [Trichinella pseudospiralis]